MLSSISCGADDINGVSEYIMKATGGGRLLMYGSSSGALRAALFAPWPP